MAKKKNNPIKWRSILGLTLIYVAVFFDLQWVWGILFLIWVIPDIISGVTYFLEPVHKKDNPILYWAIVGSWILLSVLMILSLFMPELLASS